VTVVTSLSEFGLVTYAIKGLCDRIAKAPREDMDFLTEQFVVLNEKRKRLKAEIDDVPFDIDLDF